MTIKKSDRKTVSLPTRFEPKLWAAVDKRSTPVREIQKRYETLKEDSGADSIQKELLCQRAAFLISRLETMEVEAVTQNGHFDAGVYSNLTNSLMGLLKALGLEKKSPRTFDLRAYVEGRS